MFKWLAVAAIACTALSIIPRGDPIDRKMAPFLRDVDRGVRDLLYHDAYAGIVFTDAKQMLSSEPALPTKEELLSHPLDDGSSRSALDFPAPSARDEISCDRFKSEETTVALVAGQSNAGNYTRLDDLYTPRHEFFNLNIEDGKCYIAKSVALGATGHGSAFVLPLADELMDAGLARSVLIVPIAIGGTYIEEWQPGSRYFQRFSRALAQLRTYHLAPTYVIWHQGEGNAIPIATGRSAGRFGDGKDFRTINVTEDLKTAIRLAYIRDFYRIVKGLRDLGMTAPIFAATATVCGDRQAEPSIRAAQEALPDPAWGVFDGPDTDVITLRHDKCHFTMAGEIVVAKMFVEKIRSYLDRK